MRNRQNFGENLKNTGNLFPIVDYEWNDIICPAINLAVGGAAPTVAVTSNIRYYVLAGGTGGTADELHGVFEMLHDYVEGEDCYLHAHWFAVASGTGAVVLGVDYGIANVNEALAFTTGVTSVQATITEDKTGVHYATNVATISGTGLKIGSQIMFRMYRPRIATNTHAENIGIITLGLHYPINSLGSKGITTK